MDSLPEGFVLDQGQAHGLPEGFELDAPASAPTNAQVLAETGRRTLEGIANIGPDVVNLAGGIMNKALPDDRQIPPLQRPFEIGTPLQGMSPAQEYSAKILPFFAGGVTGKLATGAGLVSALRTGLATGITGMTGDAVGRVTGSPYAELATDVLAPIGASNAARALTQTPAASEGLNLLRDAATKQAQELGYKIPPADTNPTFLNRQVQAMSGAGPQNDARRLNATAGREAAAKDFGVPTKEMTPQGLRDIEKPAQAIYEEVKKLPAIFRTSQVSAPYQQAIDEIGTVNKAMADKFPGLESPEVDKVTQALSSGKPFNGQEAIQALRIMRDRAATYAKQHANSDNGNPDAQRIAQAYSGGAKALEGLMDAELKRQGMGSLMADFQDSRRTIAKAKTLESAMDDVGNIDPLKLKKLADSGMYLSGNMEKMANVAGVYGNSVRLPKNNSQISASGGISAGDAISNILHAIPSALVTSRPYRAAFGGLPSYANPLANALAAKNAYGVSGVTVPLNAQYLAQALRQQNTQQ
jgi:hypothetical protein